jgi:hypothetical protein
MTNFLTKMRKAQKKLFDKCQKNGFLFGDDILVYKFIGYIGV